MEYPVICPVRPVWVSYPLKQGLKLALSATIILIGSVWVSYPLKQGLKLIRPESLNSLIICLSQLSIKTRIETEMNDQEKNEMSNAFESAIH